MGVPLKNLQDLLQRTDRIHIDIHRWQFGVEDREPPDIGTISFNGFLSPKKLYRQEICVIGGIHFPDDRLKDFGDHPFFHAGKVRLEEVNDKPDEVFITLDLRLHRLSHDSFWKALVLGTCNHNKNKITLSIGIRHPTPSDWEQIKAQGYKEDPLITAVEPDSVRMSVGTLVE